MRVWLSILMIAFTAHSSRGEPPPSAGANAATWRKAALSYDKAVAAVAHPSEDLAYEAVFAWGMAIPADASPPTPVLTPDEAAQIKAIDTYLAVATSTDNVPTVLFARAATMRRHERLDEAIPAWIEIVTKFPEHASAELAADLLLDTLNRQGKNDELVDWAEKLRADRRLVNSRPNLAAELATIHVDHIRRRADALIAAANGDRLAFGRAARMYRDAYREVPGYGHADELLLNAGASFENAGDSTHAIEVYRELVKRFPKSMLAVQAQQRLVVL